MQRVYLQDHDPCWAPDFAVEARLVAEAAGA